LPLRGKILNVYKARDDKVLQNAEVRSMIQAVGIGIGAEIDLSKRRYDKIVIMTDADVDGSHIRTLLMTFFYRQMYELIKTGHVYVAQPPLYRVVRRKKDPQYVQTDEEMKRILLDAGLTDAAFDPGDGRLIEGDDMEQLCRILSAMEEPLLTLERRGVSLRMHATRQNLETGRLPVYHVVIEGEEEWFTSRANLETYLEEREKRTGKEVKLEGHSRTQEEDSETPESEEDADRPRMRLVEFHEVRTLNNQLAELRELGFEIDSLLPEDRTGMEGSRYTLRRGDREAGLDDLRSLLPAVREAGETGAGMKITRFKGLGEMNPEELRQTTLDPANRTLLKVTMEDAGAADDLFRVLMGEHVEPRREFIQKNALDVKNLDV